MSERAPLPFLWGVLYVHPNQDGTPKSCKNCFMWASKVERCIIHQKGVRVTGDMVCGYQVTGEPIGEWMEIPGIERVEPSLSGLEKVGQGTMCGSCIFFEQTSERKGLCHGVAAKNGKPPEKVEFMGCCARWERRS